MPILFSYIVQPIAEFSMRPAMVASALSEYYILLYHIMLYIVIIIIIIICH